MCEVDALLVQLANGSAGIGQMLACLVNTVRREEENLPHVRTHPVTENKLLREHTSDIIYTHKEQAECG